MRLAIAARNVLFEMAEREGIDFDLERRGILHFYSQQKDLAHARMVNGLLAEGGLVRRELSPAEIREVEPALHGDFVGGFLTESDSSGDIHKFTMGLAAACARRGADLKFGTDVYDVAAIDGGVQISSSGGEEQFDGVVVSAGVRSRAIAAALGDRVNIYPVKGYSITVQLDDAESQAAAPWISLLDDKSKIVASRFGKDRFRIAGTAEFTGANRDIRADRIRPLVEWCEKHFPGDLDRARDAVGGAQADDAVDAAAGRPRQEARCLLQHRPRPSRLDPLRCHRRMSPRASPPSWPAPDLRPGARRRLICRTGAVAGGRRRSAMVGARRATKAAWRARRTRRWRRVGPGANRGVRGAAAVTVPISSAPASGRCSATSRPAWRSAPGDIGLAARPGDPPRRRTRRRALPLRHRARDAALAPLGDARGASGSASPRSGSACCCSGPSA